MAEWGWLIHPRPSSVAGEHTLFAKPRALPPAAACRRLCTHAPGQLPVSIPYSLTPALHRLPPAAAAWMALVPGLVSLELENAADWTVGACRFPPGLTHLELSYCGEEGLTAFPQHLGELASLASLSLQVGAEPGASLPGRVGVPLVGGVGWGGVGWGGVGWGGVPRRAP